MPISLYFTFRITHYFILFDHTRSFLNPVPHTLKPEPPHSIVSPAYPWETPQLGPVCFARPFNSTNPRPSARCRSRRAHGPPPLGTPPPNNCSLPRAPRSTSVPSHPATHFTQHPQPHLARAPCSRRVPQFRALRPGRSWVWDEERASSSSSGAAAVAAALLPELAQGPPPPRPHGRLPPLPSSAGRRAETRWRGCGRSARGSTATLARTRAARPSPRLGARARACAPASQSAGRVLAPARRRCAAREEVAAERRARET